MSTSLLFLSKAISSLSTYQESVTDSHPQAHSLGRSQDCELTLGPSRLWLGPAGVGGGTRALPAGPSPGLPRPKVTHSPSGCLPEGSSERKGVEIPPRGFPTDGIRGGTLPSPTTASSFFSYISASSLVTPSM